MIRMRRFGIAGYVAVLLVNVPGAVYLHHLQSVTSFVSDTSHRV